MSLDALAGGFLLTAAAWLTAAAAARCSSRLLPARSPDRAEAFLRTALVAVLFIVLPVAALGLLGLLTRAALALVAVVLYLLSRRLEPPIPATGWWKSLRPIRWPIALSALVVWGDLVTNLPAAPVDWDAMTYHLYLPARWLQEGRLFHIPTVFSDNAAAFAPQNGALFFAWLMALAGSDAVVNVCQVFCLILLAVALYRLCRLLDVAAEPAALAALTVFWLAPIRRWTLSANVDVFLVAFWLAAFYWGLCYWRRPATGTAAASGLALGLAAGTKTIGLPLAALTALGLIPVLVYQQQWRRLVLYLLGLVAGGGWWYLRNAWHFGNPLFPVTFGLGPLSLPGAYDTDAIRAGEFHLDTLGEVAASVWRQFGAAASILMVLGVAVLGAGALRDALQRKSPAAPAAFLFGLAVLWAALFGCVVPHNDQARFLIPALVLGLAGWARVLGWARRFGRWGSRSAWLLGIVAAGANSVPWRAWAERLATLAEGGVDVGRWTLFATLLGALAAGAFFVALRNGPAYALLGAIPIALILALGLQHSDQARGAFLARADFRGWAEGYLPFNRPDAPPEPLNIAYAGANVPYALMGSGWRHRVVYVNTQGEAGDGFYDFWRRDRRQHSYHKPGIYRGDDDYQTWLDHVERAEIDLLVVFRLHWAEARYLCATASGFPVEQTWARAHPERFEPVLAGQAAEIYRFVPP